MPLLLFLRSVGVVLKVALYQNYGGALVAGAGGQVAQGADQVRQAAGGSALGDPFPGAVLPEYCTFLLISSDDNGNPS